jgi:hypothetical protein
MTDAPDLQEGEWIVILSRELIRFDEYIFPITFSDSVDDYAEASADYFGMYQVKNVTDVSFDVESAIDLPAVGSWKSLEPYYMYGHRREISNRLLMKDKDKVFKYQKYPLFALRLPSAETIEDDIHQVSLNMAILGFTNKNYRANDRYDNVIHPILMPLYYEFLDKVKDSAYYMGQGRPYHTRVDRLFYGIDALEGNEAYIFNDPLDGIELLDLEINLLDTNC